MPLRLSKTCNKETDREIVEKPERSDSFKTKEYSRMKVFVLNCGKNFIESTLLDLSGDNFQKYHTLFQGNMSPMEMGVATLRYECVNRPVCLKMMKISSADHYGSINAVLNFLVEQNIISDISEINAIGHRVVHGGESYYEPTLVTDEVIAEIRNLIDLAPLHNTYNLRGIEACRKILPHIPQVAVFDTAFHHEMPPEAYIYGLPYHLYTKYQIRKYGFHGPSHEYVSTRASELLNTNFEEMRIISCHLGKGSSISAVKGGKSIDNSMGYTPLGGLVMETRCGDIDPQILIHLMATEALTLTDIDVLLNTQSGLLGISGVSNRMDEVITAAESGNERARLAVDIFSYHVKRYLGSYAFILGWVDAVVFTGGIGENAPLIREKACSGLESRGIVLDPKRNAAHTEQKEGLISTDDSPIKVFCIPTNEEFIIARKTARIVASRTYDLEM